MRASFHPLEDCIRTLLKEPPSPFGQALLTLIFATKFWYRYSIAASRRTYRRICTNRLRLTSVVAVSGSLLILMVAWIQSIPVTFAEGEAEKIDFILSTYIHPETRQLHEYFGLDSVALAGQNVGGNYHEESEGHSHAKREHIVLKGETLSGIAAQYDLSSNDFMVVNSTLDSKDDIFPGQVLEVPEDAATPEQVAIIKADLEKKAKEKAQASKASNKVKAASVNANDDGLSFIDPVPGKTYNSQGFTGSHPALDEAAPVGTPVRASEDGVVILASKGQGDYGTMIMVKHSGTAYTTLYAHLSSLNVTQGDVVKRGQTIGRVGSTGRSSGPHLHFEIRKNGSQVNPVKLLK